MFLAKILPLDVVVGLWTWVWLWALALNSLLCTLLRVLGREAPEQRGWHFSQVWSWFSIDLNSNIFYWFLLLLLTKIDFKEIQHTKRFIKWTHTHPSPWSNLTGIPVTSPVYKHPLQRWPLSWLISSQISLPGFELGAYVAFIQRCLWRLPLGVGGLFVLSAVQCDTATAHLSILRGVDGHWGFRTSLFIFGWT